MRMTSNEAKLIMNGDYYEIGKNGRYQKHRDVAVHCHDHNNPQFVSQLTNDKINYNQRSQSGLFKQQSLKQSAQFPGNSLKSPFLQNCPRILQKQQVNSIHEQDNTHEQKNRSQQPNSNIRSSQIRDKNSKMRRSTQNQVSPKKGILKRSMMDKKDQQIIYNQQSQKNQIKNFKLDRSVRIDNFPSQIIKQQQRQEMLQRQYEALAQRFKTTSSEIDDESVYYHNRDVSQRIRINNNHLRNEVQKHKQDLRATARPGHQSNYIHRNLQHTPIRINTQGQQTVQNSPKRHHHNDQLNEQEMSTDNNISIALYEQIKFLKHRFTYLEQQLKGSQERMKKIELQKELKLKEEEIQIVKKQNQQLRLNNMCVRHESNQHQRAACHQNNFNLEQFQSIIKLVQQKAAFFISFFVVILICMMVGKQGTCSK